MRLSTMPTDVLIGVCRRLRLCSALVCVHNQALDDFHSPVDELLAASSASGELGEISISADLAGEWRDALPPPLAPMAADERRACAQKVNIVGAKLCAVERCVLSPAPCAPTP